MKHYIGIKQVEAEPMTKGEAYEKGLLCEYAVLNTKEKNKVLNAKEKGKMGYHVKYEGGYESWFPAEAFQRSYMVAESAIDRIKIEYDELLERYNKLNAFIAGEKFKSLNEDNRNLLYSQLGAMFTYLGILNERIGIMDK